MRSGKGVCMLGEEWEGCVHAREEWEGCVHVR